MVVVRDGIWSWHSWAKPWKPLLLLCASDPFKVAVGTWKSLTEGFLMKTKSCIAIWPLHIWGSDMSALPAIIHGALVMCVPSPVCPELSPQTENQCSVTSNYTITSPDCRAFCTVPLCTPLLARLYSHIGNWSCVSLVPHCPYTLNMSTRLHGL